MSKKLYVVMKETTSPIYLNYSRPDAVFEKKKDAVDYCESKGRKATRLCYYVTSAINGDKS